MSKNLTPEERAAPPKTVRVADPELQALSKIGSVLNGLDETTRRRVLAWIKDRYELKESTP